MAREHLLIANALFQALGEGERLYAVLDAARSHNIPYKLLEADVPYSSLYHGQMREQLWYVAPYLLSYHPYSQFFYWHLEQGWGNSWGIFFASSVSIEELRQHFRQFLTVRGENDKELFFRFYDPRVLRVFLPTCSTEEAQQFFGPISRFLVEDDEPGVLVKFAAARQGVEREATPLFVPESAG